MQPTWESPDGTLRLWHGDSRQILPTLPDGCVDLVATDPPYGIEYVTNRRVATDAPPPIEGDEEPPLWCVEHLARVTRDGGAVYLFTRFDVADEWRAAMRDAGLQLKTTIVWDKTVHTAGDLDGDYGCQVELILFAHKGRHLLRGHRDSNLWRCLRPKSDLHPTPKPPDLLMRIVRNSSDSGGIVLDPFMGTVPTGLACCRLGRRFWGMDLHGPYFDHAMGRLLREQARHPLFEEPPRQTEIFGAA